MELTVQQAKEQPANFMYIFADEQKFLQYIKPEYANIIRAKKANQNKLIMLSAAKFGGTITMYTNAIREAFIEQYGVTPAEALITLAQGGEVAGKNWSEGVYGVGALPTTYSIQEINDQPVTVDATTGHIFLGSEDITDESKTVYGTVGKQAIAYQYFSREVAGMVFMSQYHKLQKKYAAQSWSDDHGTYSAKTGKAITGADGASIWGSILESVQVVVSWLLSLFGVSAPERETISAANTLPNQQTDGFVQEAGMVDSAGLLLILAAGGALIATGALKIKKGNK